MGLSVDIEKKLGAFRLRVRFEAGDGVTALLGASGSGKSVTLKCIAGIERPDRGRITLDGAALYDSASGVDLPPQARRTGLLFQNCALFPHWTVRRNLWAGAVRERDRVRRRELVAEALERFGLTELAERYPSQLSGGQRQRTALARVLLSRPRAVLLDEPFSALDAHLRGQMEQEVREILRGYGGTVLLVTHDREEAYRMADGIVVLDGGAVAVYGPKEEVFADPRTRAAALLTGCGNLSRLEPWGDGNRARAVDWGVTLTLPRAIGDAQYVGIRGRDIRSAGEQNSRPAAEQDTRSAVEQDSRSAGQTENRFLCRVEDVTENPFSVTVSLRPVGTEGMSGGGGTPSGEIPSVNGGTVPLRWELDRELWERLRGGTAEVILPPSALLLLTE